MHIHAGVLDFAIVGAYIIIFMFIWRWVATRLSDKPVGQAMAALV